VKSQQLQNIILTIEGDQGDGMSKVSWKNARSVLWA
jgi:hypothetical protein